MRYGVLLTAIYAVSLATSAAAATVAFDSASQSAYSYQPDGAWKGLQPQPSENPPGTDDGGYGFLPWNFAGGHHDAMLSPYGRLNHFIDGVDFPASSFNNLGAPAFALTNANQAHYGFTARATRVFSEPLIVGGSVSLQFDNPLPAPLKPNDDTGFIIRLNSGGGPILAGNSDVKERFGFFAFHGFNGGYWNKADAVGTTNTGLTPSQTSSGALFQLTLTGGEAYRFEILPLAGGTPLYTTTGNLANPGAAIDTLEIVMFGNGSGNGLTGSSAAATGAREFFFNNLTLKDSGNPVEMIPGDYNQDGKVDAADYIRWRERLNVEYTVEHYHIWRANFGATIGGPRAASANGGAAVPEPATVVLLLCLGAGAAMRSVAATSRM